MRPWFPEPQMLYLNVVRRHRGWVEASGGLSSWGRIEPLLPKKQRRFRYPGRKPLSDRQALQGILFVLQTGIAWRHLPLELGFGSGSTCYRRMVEWQQAGVWERLHASLLAELRAAGELEWSRAVADSSHVQAKKDLMKGASGRVSVAAGGPLRDEIQFRGHHDPRAAAGHRRRGPASVTRASARRESLSTVAMPTVRS